MLSTLFLSSLFSFLFFFPLVPRPRPFIFTFVHKIDSVDCSQLPSTTPSPSPSPPSSTMSYHPYGPNLSTPAPQRYQITDGPPNPYPPPPPPPPRYVPQEVSHGTAHLERAVQQFMADERPENTKKAIDTKIKEFFRYCEEIYTYDPHRYHLEPIKVYRFMFYQAMRSHRPRGGKNRVPVVFDKQEFNAVMDHYSKWMSENSGLPPPTPPNPLSERLFAQYKTGLKKIHEQEIARKVTQYTTFNQIWTEPIVMIHKWTKTRLAKKKKENYEEKVDHEFAPYTAIEFYPDLEKTMWGRGTPTNRAASAWLRHRYCFLQTTSGIMRSESLFRAELSDFLGVDMKRTRDPDPLYVLVVQLAFGKESKKLSKKELLNNKL